MAHDFRGELFASGVVAALMNDGATESLLPADTSDSHRGNFVKLMTMCRGVAVLLAASGFSTPQLAFAQQPGAVSPVSRKELMKQVLPSGDFRTIEAVTIELAPGAAARRHRHDVAVFVYVLEGAVENQFDAGPVRTHRQWESWWEAPGTIHDVARNASKSERARLLIVYIGEDGKAATVPLSRDSVGAWARVP